MTDPPIPALEMRELVGPTDPAAFDNPTGEPVFDVPEVRGDILDFGCGCGRLARQLIQQRPQPRSYLGVDLHRGMIDWCRANLGPLAPQFRFEHHDVFNPGFNPGSTQRAAPLPAPDESFDLVIAHSVFTHITESAVMHYLRECARVLRPDGVLHSSWFLFDRRFFPMLQRFQHALYINESDLTNAVVYDREWLQQAVNDVGLAIVTARPPKIRGFQWLITLRNGTQSIDLPNDSAPFGEAPPPVPVSDPSEIT